MCILNSCYYRLDLEDGMSSDSDNEATQLIQRHIPAALLKHAKGRELTYILPVSASTQFPGISNSKLIIILLIS